MDDLFEHTYQERIRTQTPLAARMRPRTLDEFVGQEHVLGPGKLLRRAIETDRLFSSIILWGPPGSGKTTVAQIIATYSHSSFVTLSAVMAGLPELRRVIQEAKALRRLHGKRTILFVDEVHRWNKAQQDALLPHVEDGTVIFIGATTENPYFEVIGALVSRSRIFRLYPLSENQLETILIRAIKDEERGYGKRNVILDPEASAHLIHMAGGDARNVLNALELAVESTPPNEEGNIHITLEIAQESIQRRAVLYDKEGDAHYDTISAFIKSIRGSDPDAALYWLAKMIYAGEDPRFILRRLLILAGEDVGLADPMGLVVASAAAQAFDYVGMPEGIYPLIEATLYLATAPKSNSTQAYFKAMALIEQDGAGEMPDHLKDSHRDREALGHGIGYIYPHDAEGHFVPQQYLPKELLGIYFYRPSEEGYEAVIQGRLERWRTAQRQVLGIESVKEIPDVPPSRIEELKRNLK